MKNLCAKGSNRLVALLSVVALLCGCFVASIEGQEGGGGDDSWIPQGEVVTIPPETDLTVEIEGDKGTINVESQYTINVYVVKKGESHAGSPKTELKCENTTKCCFDAVETFVLENKHSDKEVRVYYSRQLSCDGVQPRAVIVFVMVGGLFLIVSCYLLWLCLSKNNKSFSAGLPVGESYARVNEDPRSTETCVEEEDERELQRKDEGDIPFTMINIDKEPSDDDNNKK